MKNLKKWLIKKKISQEDFADMIGTSFKTVNFVLNGKQVDMKVTTLLKIKKVTGLNTDDLINDLIKG